MDISGLSAIQLLALQEQLVEKLQKYLPPEMYPVVTLLCEVSETLGEL